MKIKVLALLMVMSLNSWALSGKKVFKESNMRQKVMLLKEYKAFFAQINERLSGWEEKRRATFFKLMNEAWADEALDCIYAGWPSKRVGAYCSSPTKHNPNYQNGSCAANEMQCQPMLFGEGLCTSTLTSTDRSRAFSNCDKKFQESGKSIEDVIRDIKAKGKEPQLLELFDFADKICAQSVQAGTGMCGRLQAAVLRARAGYAKIAAEVIVNSEVVNDATVQNDLLNVAGNIDVISNATENAGRSVADCNPDGSKIVPTSSSEDLPPFERIEPRPFEFEFSTSQGGVDVGIQNTYLKDKNDPNLRPTGFEFRMSGPNEMAGSPIDPTERVERNWHFVSSDNSKRETYLWVTDDAGSGYLSQLMESVILIVPRKTPPKTEVVGDEWHVTLATGEKVIYDKKTKLIKSGVLSEGKVDLNPNRFERKFAPITYSGKGISIRVDKRGEDPRLIPGNAVITQNGKSCKVPARELWNDTDIKYADDAELLKFLNLKCGNKFSL
ncbi:MAG: hypothetical protein K2P81_01910 [Bacteriovoracaceae bacterium]|nr:hypothetical protein [Bacteriovoracaceae bacterium]